MEADSGRGSGWSRAGGDTGGEETGSAPSPALLVLIIPLRFPSPWPDRADTWALGFKALHCSSICSAHSRHQTLTLWLCQPLGAFRGLERSRWLIAYGAVCFFGGEGVVTFFLLIFTSL